MQAHQERVVRGERASATHLSSHFDTNPRDLMRRYPRSTDGLQLKVGSLPGLGVNPTLSRIVMGVVPSASAASLISTRTASLPSVLGSASHRLTSSTLALDASWPLTHWTTSPLRATPLWQRNPTAARRERREHDARARAT